MRLKIAIVAASVLALSACGDQAGSGGAGSRDQIKVVGSSTVYPFTTLVAEQYKNQNPGMKIPVVESTGTGAGIKAFCAGVGAQHPDIVNASRRLTAAEYKTCSDNGVDRIMEIQIGIDGIAFAENKSGPKMSLSPADLYMALAAKVRGQANPTKTWKDVNPSLPAIPIQVYGPPSTSGTRDALAEIILERGCLAVNPEWIDKRTKDEAGFKKECHDIRTDGPYIDAGENDNLIVQKLQSNPNAIGIFGYSYLEENRDVIQGVALNQQLPTYETISRSMYPGSRPLFIYVKKAHIGSVPGLDKFLQTYAASWNPDGPLVKRGLIAAPEGIRKASADVIANGTTLDSTTLN